MEAFKDRLKRLIGDRPTAAIARRAQVSDTALRKMLSGLTRTPDVQTADKLAKALGVTRDELLYGKKSTGPESLEQLNVAVQHYIDYEVKRKLDEAIETEIKQRVERQVAERLALLRAAWETEQDIRGLVQLLYGDVSPVASGSAPETSSAGRTKGTRQ